jgi:hypothetical protein
VQGSFGPVCGPLGGLLLPPSCSLSTMTLLYLHPHTAATILLHPDEAHNHR